MLRQPLPEAHHGPAARAAALAIRHESWLGLDAASRLAWDVWLPVRGQVSMLNQQVAKADDVTLVLDTNAVLASMDWHGVPPHQRKRVWSDVMSLHAIGSHGLRDFISICAAHHLDERLTYDPKCWKCVAFWGEAAS